MINAALADGKIVTAMSGWFRTTPRTSDSLADSLWRRHHWGRHHPRQGRGCIAPRLPTGLAPRPGTPAYTSCFPGIDPVLSA